MRIELHAIEDWEGLYIDGFLEAQSHSRLLERLLEDWAPGPIHIEHLDIVYHEDDAVDRYVRDAGDFPDTVEDLQELLDEDE